MSRPQCVSQLPGSPPHAPACSGSLEGLGAGEGSARHCHVSQPSRGWGWAVREPEAGDSGHPFTLSPPLFPPVGPSSPPHGVPPSTLSIFYWAGGLGMVGLRHQPEFEHWRFSFCWEGQGSWVEVHLDLVVLSVSSALRTASGLPSPEGRYGGHVGQ